MRKVNRTAFGWIWPAESIEKVWAKAEAVPGYDQRFFRRDACGAWIRYTEFGLSEGSEHGWHIDHIRPVSLGGDDSLENLQPLHWANNRHKGDRYPCRDCLLTDY